MNKIDCEAQFNAMLARGTIPYFELEIKGGEYLLVNFEPTIHGLTFGFACDGLTSYFDGCIIMHHDCRFSLPYDAFDDLDSGLELIYENIIEGFICANQLFPESDD